MRNALDTLPEDDLQERRRRNVGKAIRINATRNADTTDGQRGTHDEDGDDENARRRRNRGFTGAVRVAGSSKQGETAARQRRRRRKRATTTETTGTTAHTTQRTNNDGTTDVGSTTDGERTGLARRPDVRATDERGTNRNVDSERRGQGGTQAAGDGTASDGERAVAPGTDERRESDGKRSAESRYREPIPLRDARPNRPDNAPQTRHQTRRTDEERTSGRDGRTRRRTTTTWSYRRRRRSCC